MEEPTPKSIPRFQKGTSGSLKGAWPLLLATAWLVAAVVLGAQDGVTSTSQDVGTFLILLATMTGGLGAIAYSRLPADAPAVAPYVGLAAAVAAILALTPIQTVGSQVSLPGFLLQAPWHYALVPLAVHFGFALGWPHRRRYWGGVVVGWYLLNLVMFIAAAGGLASGETSLYQVTELTFRQKILDPIGIVIAIAALGLALSSPQPGHRQRRAASWGFAALLLGLGPQVLGWVVPALARPLDGAMTPTRLALGLVPFLGLAAVLALPYVNPQMRDLKSLRLAHALLDETDLVSGVRQIANALLEEFEAEGVKIRLNSPQLIETVGTMTSGADSISDSTPGEGSRVLVAPMGRIGDPLGEVRLMAPSTSTFDKRERDWLAAFLMPLAPVLRSRARETAARARFDSLCGDMREASAELARLADGLQSDSVNVGIGLPPEVDASMVLAQLTDSLDGVSRQSEGLESLSGDSRNQLREASDEVAQALDALGALARELLHLNSYRDEIAASNLAVSGVAFRTNLLANNAALEANRAGELGETFGVLAEEIRRLADLTSTSSTEIEDRTQGMSADVGELIARLEQVQGSLRSAIRSAESGEEIVARVGDSAAAVQGWVRSLKPAVEEAHEVARRRSARDHKLTLMLHEMIDTAASREQDASTHRNSIERVAAMLKRQAG